MKGPSHQRGVGAVGWMLLILLFGGALSLGLKLVPVYIQNASVVSVMDGMAEAGGFGGETVAKIEHAIDRRFSLNEIRDFDRKANMTVNRDKMGAHILLDYEVRLPFFRNVDLIVSFDHRVDLRE